MTTEVRRGLFTYETGAEYVQVDPRTMRRLVAARKIAHVKIGRLIRFRQEDLDRFIESRVVRPLRNLVAA